MQQELQRARLTNKLHALKIDQRELENMLEREKAFLSTCRESIARIESDIQLTKNQSDQLIEEFTSNINEQREIRAEMGERFGR